MKKAIIIAVSAALVIAAAAAAVFALTGKQFTGYVREENSGAPLSGIAVSDGRNVVKTENDGSFKLKGYKHTRFITMTVPTGYTAKSYYIPVEKEKESYDFALEEQENPVGEHTFLQISDSEVGKDGVGEWIEETKRLVEETKPAFLIHTGDICYEDGLKSHINGMNSENMGCDVKYVIGNHDYVEGDYGEQLFESIYGPVWYSFEVGKVHYVVTPFQFGDYKSGYGKNDRWKWLKNDLENTAPDMKVVMFNHTNFQGDSDYVLKYGANKIDLKAHNLTAWIFGHYHYNLIDEINGVLNISTARPDSGGIDQSPAASREISVDKDGSILSTQLHYFDMNGKEAVSPESTQWEAQLDGNVLFCDSLKVNDKVFMGTVDDDYPKNCGVYAVNAKDGKILWKYKTENSIKNNLGYYNGKIVAQDCEGRIYCLDEKDGKLLWQDDAKLNSPASTSTGLCVDDGTVYVGNGRIVCAYDIESGKQLWRIDEKQGECSPAAMSVSGDNLIVSSHWNKLYALDKKSGEKAWEIVDEKLRFRSSTPYCTDDGKIFVAATDTLFTIDGADGKILNKYEMKDYNLDVSAAPVIDGDTAYLSTATKGVLAYDMKSSKMLWSFETKENLLYTSPYTGKGSKTVEGTMLLDGGKLIFGASDGYVYTVDKNSGAPVKEEFTGMPMLSSPVLEDGLLYAADFSGRIICMKAQ